MPANNSGWQVHVFATLAPQSIGLLWSPSRRNLKIFPHLEYALDNGLNFSQSWSKEEWFNLIEAAQASSKAPLFLVVPDKWKDADTTLRLWREWYPILKGYQIPLAFVLQDGINFKDIPDEAEWLFVGGSDEWRYPLMQEIVALGRPVHWGRVNGKRLWECYFNGVRSCDGSGYFKGCPYQLAALEHYVLFRAGSLPPPKAYSTNLLSGRAFHYEYRDQVAVIQPNGRSSIFRLERRHIEEVLESWGAELDTIDQSQYKYFICHDGQYYPLKLVLSLANWKANGRLLQPNEFSSGRDANRLVLRMGFEVVNQQTGQTLALADLKRRQVRSNQIEQPLELQPKQA